MRYLSADDSQKKQPDLPADQSDRACYEPQAGLRPAAMSYDRAEPGWIERTCWNGRQRLKKIAQSIATGMGKPLRIGSPGDVAYTYLD